MAYALLSGADGWMFDGEDALGQVDTMSLDNQRNLQLALARDPLFLDVAEEVAAEMNQLGPGLLRPPHHRRLARRSSTSPRVIFRARGLHLDDRHVREADGAGFSASIADLALYVVNNHRRQRGSGASHRPLPAQDPDRRGGGALERPAPGAGGHLGLPAGTVKVYVLVEQMEAASS